MAAFTQRVSESGTGQEANAANSQPAITGDGQIVLFASQATNLTTENSAGIFLRNIEQGSLLRLSAGTQPAVSRDGSVFAFVQHNSASGETNLFMQRLDGSGSVYQADTDQTFGTAHECRSPSLTANGSQVFFAANRYVNGVFDIYRYRSGEGDVIRVSSPDGVSGAQSNCSNPMVSDDGRFVVFRSAAGNLTAAGSNGVWQVFLWDRDAAQPQLTLISADASGNPSSADCSPPAISGDGSRVAFSCADETLVSGDGNNHADTFVYNTAAGSLTIASLAADGTAGNGPSSTTEAAALSGDGSFLLFASSASNLVAGDSNGSSDLFLKDLIGGFVQRVSVSSAGIEADGSSGSPCLSSDGSLMAYQSYATNLVTEDRNNALDVFAHDPNALFNNPAAQGMAAAAMGYAGSSGSGSGSSLRKSARKYNINPTTLNLTIEHKLFHMPVRGPDIEVNLYYNADFKPNPGAVPGPFGHGWRIGQDWELLFGEGGSTVTVKKGDGRELVFTTATDLWGPFAEGDYPVVLTPPEGCQDSLELTGGDFGASGFYSFSYHEKATRTEIWFNSNWYTDRDYGVMERIQDRHGNGFFYNHSEDDWDNPTKVILMDIGVGHNWVEGEPEPTDYRSVAFTYNENSLCTKIEALDSAGTPTGRVATFTYDAAGNLTSITDMAGYQTTFIYDADHYMVRKTTEGKAVNFSWVPRGVGAGKRLSSVTDIGGTANFAFSGGATTRTSAGGRSTGYTGNENGQVTTISDPMGHVRSVGYTGSLPTSYTDANGKATAMEYDDKGRLTRQTDPERNVFQFEYDATTGNLAQHITPDGTWNYTYDADDNLTVATSPMGHQTTYAYDGNGQITSVTDDNGNAIAFTYDDFGNITTVTDQLSKTTTYEYDSYGLQCAAITDARGKTKTLSYDGNDRLTEFGSNSGTVTITYDAFHPYSVTNETAQTTEVARNVMGALTSLIPPLNNVTSYVYDDDNRLEKVVDGNGRITRFEYDAAGRKTAETDPAGLTTHFEYDSEGNLLEIRDARSAQTSFTYDGNNRLVRITYASGHQVNYTRDGMGRIDAMTNGRSQAVDFVYDNDGRMTNRNLGGGGPNYQYTYDGVGNLLSVMGNGETTTYTYTVRNEVASIAYPGTGALTAGFGYDAAGNLDHVNYSGGITATYTYDDFNRIRIPDRLTAAVDPKLLKIKPKPNQVTRLAWDGRQVDFQYDAAARLTRITRSNGAVTQIGYDANGRVDTIEHSNAEGNFLDLDYTYNGANQTTRLDTTHAVMPALAAGTVSGSYNAANEMGFWGGSACSYDNDGNLLTGGLLADGSYDAENRLLSVTNNGSAMNCEYDGNGLRTLKVFGGTTIRFHYDRSGRLLFESVNGGVTARYFYAGSKLVAMERSGNVYYFHFDRNGNTLALTDDSGNVVTQYAYEPNGLKTVAGTQVDNPFTFSGEYGAYDDGDGLYFMHKRHYDAWLGRFLQRDPAGFDAGVNLYTYANNDPVTYIDPDGDFGFWTALAIYGTYKVLKKAYDYGKKWRDRNTQRRKKAQSGNEDDYFNAELQRRQDAPQAGKEGLEVAGEVYKTTAETATGFGSKYKDAMDAANDAYDYVSGSGGDDEED